MLQLLYMLFLLTKSKRQIEPASSCIIINNPVIMMHQNINTKVDMMNLLVNICLFIHPVVMEEDHIESRFMLFGECHFFCSVFFSTEVWLYMFHYVH